MKKLFMTRHAKSDWSFINQMDFDRELNERGLNDAPMMGKRLAEKNIRLDKIIASAAMRTRQTAMLMATELKYPLEKIFYVDRLYHSAPHIIQDVILETEDECENIMVVCHNNGITDFVNQLAGFVTDNIKTCGVVAFEIDINSWSEFPAAKKTLLFYDYPKNY